MNRLAPLTGAQKLLDSSVFVFCGLVLLTSLGFVVWGNLLIDTWLDAAIYLAGIGAGKEGIKYGASAYEQKGK